MVSIKKLQNKAAELLTRVLKKTAGSIQGKLYFSYGGSAAVLAVLGAVTVLMQLFIQNGLFFYGYFICLRSPLLLLLNYAPVFLISLLLFSLTNRIWAGYIPVNFLFLLGMAVDRYKIYFRDEPFKPVDLILTGEALNISQNYDFAINKKLVVCIILFLLISLFLIKYVKTRGTSKRVRISASAALFALSAGLYIGVYSQNSIYDNIYIGENIYQETEIFNRKGFIYSFLNDINSLSYKKPRGYSDKFAEEILAGYPAEINGKLPNVIGVMSESFFDIQEAGNIAFYENPLQSFNELKQKSMYGSIIVPGFAGSTASTECEFLTGINISLIDDSLPMLYKTYIKNNIDSIVRCFKNEGFYAEAIHPGHKWFYNRDNVYRRMGFDRYTALDDIDRELEMKNYYTTDKETMRLITDSYDEYLKSGKHNGYFSFTVTIQNHGPYPDTPSDRERILVRPDGISDELYNIMDNYAGGLKDAADLVCGLKDYIDSVDEPTVLIFFGDHLPFLDPNLEGYASIDYNVSGNDKDSILKRYSVPYLICSNKSAEELIEENGGKAVKGYGGTVSSNYLSALLFDYIAVEPSGYFAFVKDMKKHADIISPFMIMKDGQELDRKDEAISEWIDKYKILQYNNIKTNR